MKKLFTKSNFFVFISFLLLTISYAFNPFNITDDNYRHFDRADEANVMGRMFLSREKGIFYKGGITGQYYNYKYSEEEINSDDPPLILLDSTTYGLGQLYDDYVKDRKVYGGNFHPYKTQPGGHAMLYSILQKISPFSGSVNLTFFRLLTVALSALMFALFAGWVFRNFGSVVGATTFLLIFLSPWFFRFAFNLWWALWSFYIPFVTMLLILERRERKGIKLFDNKLILYLCIALFVKFQFTGAEFITSTLVTAVAPIIYYLFLKKVEIKKGLTYFVKASIFACLTVVVGLLQLAMQIRFLEGSWAAGFRHVFSSYAKHDTDAIWMQDSGRLELIWTYLKHGDVFGWQFCNIFNFNFGVLILIITGFSFLILAFKKVIKSDTFDRYRAMIITTAISIAGPLSWLIFFPAHASFHTFLDYIIWYMPYALLGFVVIGIGIKVVIERVKASFGAKESLA